jgi:phosphoribosylaminoimidazole-succinocarboxamide synthase
VKLVARGSNKDIYEIPGEANHLAFKFSGRISVFDVGALPEEIPGRPESLSLFARAVAEHFEARGVPQAYDSALSKKHGVFVQKRVSHPRVREAGTGPVFVPLEVIVRWGVPVGSSLVKKDPARYPVGSRFEKAAVDYTTKLEAQDRAVDRTEAQSLCPAGLDLDVLENFVLDTAEIVKGFFASKGLEIWDAKFELGYDPEARKLFLVDAVTPDEIRLTLKGFDRVPLSKELLRFWLRQTAWFDEVAARKARGGADWKQGLSRAPRLGAWRLNALSKIYQGLAELVSNQGSQTLLAVLRDEGPRPKVHVHGAGGREAALKWRFVQEGCEISEDPSQSDLVFVTMDHDLAEGVADRMRADGLWCIGASREASRVEWSKHFGREIAMASGLVCPRYSTQLSDFDRGDRVPVLKMDGLAAGKGVFLFENWNELEAQIAELEKSATAYHLEERCEGFEASAFFNIERDAWGRVKARYLGSAQDFKRRYLGDEGPNTGGMGALAPHPKLQPEDISLFTTWAELSAATLDKRGTPYRGVIYLGLMKDTKRGWVLIEYNARFGDPETQALVLLWPEGEGVARGLGQLSLSSLPQAVPAASENKTLCLALVHPEYPKSCQPLKLVPWEPKSTPELCFFRTTSLTGRLAYLVGRGPSHLEAGDRIFDVLLQSPWKDQVEWRADILK